MHKSFIDKASSLNNKQEAYATAMIVRRKIPSSGKPGDKAIITKDGQIHGWIGGGCTRGIVLKEALNAIADGKPRYVSISPDKKEGDVQNIKTYTMTCQSGGEVELYIEPVLPKPNIVIIGTSHIAMALAKLASAMEYKVIALMKEVDKNIFPNAIVTSLADYQLEEDSIQNYIVVCTQGEGDAEALHKGIELDCPYLSFVASRKKANAIFNDLRDMGVSFDQLKKIKTPAGMDIGAKLPEEVAISILAEIIKDFRIKTKGEIDTLESNVIPNDAYYKNPVCNIPIQKSTAKYVLDYEGEQVYFCCDGCKNSFEKEPSKYMVKSN